MWPLVLLFTVALSQRCAPRCKFRFADESTVFPRGAPLVLPVPERVAPFPVLTRQMFKIGYVRLVDEAKIQTASGREVNISEWRRNRVQRPFPSDTFGVARVRLVGQSTVTRRRLDEDQLGALEGACVIVPVRRYERLRRRDGEMKVMDVFTDRGGECVSFVVRVPQLIVELSWDSGDDFDLSVVQPDGEVISRFKPEGGSGGVLTGDAPLGVCELERRVGIERVVYGREAMVEEGRYRAVVRHFAKCVDRTRWVLRVWRGDGGRVREWRGVGGDGVDDVVGEIDFRV